MLDNLENHEFSFSIMDEIFVSTNYYEGVSGAYAICKKMTQYPNSLAIITTHFPVLSQKCRDDPLFETYYFPVQSLPDGNIKGTYKLTPGESQQHLAIKMLQLKGFDDDIIKNATEMYAYLMEQEKIKTKNNKEVKEKVKEKVKEEVKEEVEKEVKEKVDKEVKGEVNNKKMCKNSKEIQKLNKENIITKKNKVLKDTN